METSKDFLKGVKWAGSRMLYPVLGFLPGECQEWLAERYKLNADYMTAASIALEGAAASFAFFYGREEHIPSVALAGSLGYLDAIGRGLVNFAELNPVGNLFLEIGSSGTRMIVDIVKDVIRNG